MIKRDEAQMLAALITYLTIKAGGEIRVPMSVMESYAGRSFTLTWEIDVDGTFGTIKASIERETIEGGSKCTSAA